MSFNNISSKTFQHFFFLHHQKHECHVEKTWSNPSKSLLSHCKRILLCFCTVFVVPTVNDRSIKPPFLCKAKRLDLNKNYPNPPRIKSFSTNRTRKWSFIHSTHLPRNHYELAVSFLKGRVADSTPTNSDYRVFTLVLEVVLEEVWQRW